MGGIAAFAIGVIGAAAQEPANTAVLGSPYETKPITNSQSNLDKSALTAAERHFIERTAKMNEEEVAISRVVAQNGAASQVRDFAAEMVSSHEKVGSELSTIASKKGVTLPEKSVSTQKWSESKPADIDEDYVKKMISEHKTLIELFEQAAKSNDADIAGFASTCLPDLRAHYTKAETLKNQVKS